MPQNLDETIALQEGTVLWKQHLAVDVEDFPVKDLDVPNTESDDDGDVFLEEEDEEEDDGDVFFEEDDNGDEEGDNDDGDGDIYRDREMDQCAYELRRACWESARLAQTVLRFDDANLPAVHQYLQEKGMGTIAGDKFIKFSAGRILRGKLSYVLNAIRDAIQLKVDPAIPLSKMVFLLFHRSTASDADKENKIYPDGVGVSVPPPDIGNLSTALRVPRPALSQLEFIIEVGDCETELLRRAALHARACFAVRPYRSSFVSIIFNSHSFDVRVLLFHRSGVVSSPLMELFTPGGFRDFVRHSSGLFSRGTAGMSFSRSRRFIFVQAHVAGLGGGQPKFIVLYIRQVIIQQLCLRGRETRSPMLRRLTGRSNTQDIFATPRHASIRSC